MNTYMGSYLIKTVPNERVLCNKILLLQIIDAQYYLYSTSAII
jgi:hypothetical protein